MRKVILATMVIAALILGFVIWQVWSTPKLVESPVEPVGRRSTVQFAWSRGIAAAERQIAVSPAVEYQASWNADGRRLTLTPVDGWEWQITYTAQLPGGKQVSFTAQPSPTISLFAAGDTMLDMMPGDNIAQYGPESVFVGMGGIISAADIAFVNLEGPVSERGAAVAKRYTFCGRPDALQALSAVGVDVVSFANNHALDYGQQAFLDTLQHLTEYGIGYAGAGADRSEALRPWITEVDGLRVAFLAFGQRDVLPGWAQTVWLAGEDRPGIVVHDVTGGREAVLQAIGNARETADLVVVSMHWGYERHVEPFAWQREFGRAMIDAGATAIIGHHPHLPYGMEVYQGSPIFYSLGNFLFHPYVPAQRESYVATLEMGLTGVSRLELVPIVMDQGTTAVLVGTDADQVLRTVQTRAAKLGTELQLENDRLVWQRER